ncbi:MAG: DMP19 family protein [Tepidisphaeraceae bacterium]
MVDTSSNRDQHGADAWQLIEPYWGAVSIYDGPMIFLRGFEKLPEAARHVFAIWWCDSEVCNGGFHQFFANSTGVLAPEALEGFRTVGLHDCAKLLKTALDKFGDPFPRDQEARHAALRAIELPGEKRKAWDPFFDLDDRYYIAKDRESFYERLDAFAQQHAR